LFQNRQAITEGEIILGNINDIKKGDSKALAHFDLSRRWTDNTIPYVINSNL